MKWFIVAQQGQTVSIDKSKLTEQQLRELKVDDVGKQVTQIKGIAQEIGDAFITVVHALGVEVNTFADTKAGQFTMIIIGYSVLGKDMIRAAIGIPIWFLGTFFFVFVFYKNCVSRNILATKEGPFWNRKKTYNYKDLNDGDYQWGHFFGYVIFTLIMAAVTLIG
jgi:hypothetical protein